MALETPPSTQPLVLEATQPIVTVCVDNEEDEEIVIESTSLPVDVASPSHVNPRIPAFMLCSETATSPTRISPNSPSNYSAPTDLNVHNVTPISIPPSYSAQLPSAPFVPTVPNLIDSSPVTADYSSQAARLPAARRSRIRYKEKRKLARATKAVKADKMVPETSSNVVDYSELAFTWKDYLKNGPRILFEDRCTFFSVCPKVVRCRDVLLPHSTQLTL